MKFTKPVLDYEKQLERLKYRWLIIEDDKKVIKYLNHIWYFRLTWYFKRYQKADNNFYEWITFAKILDTYSFDRKLRLLTLDAIEKIEVSLKSQINNHMTIKYWVFWYNKKWLFNLPTLKKCKLYDKLLKDINLLKYRKTSLFIKSFFHKYDEEENIPSRMVFEESSMWLIWNVYNILNLDDKRFIASMYNTSVKDLQTWIYLINTLRNISAHHWRLWNKKYTSNLRVSDVVFKDQFKTSEKNELREVIPNYFNASLVINYLLDIVHPNFNWIENLSKLFNDTGNKFIENMWFPKWRWESKNK